MLLRGLVTVCIGAALVAAPGRARGDAAEVEALIAKGNQLRRAGTPGPALPYFQKAYELAHTPRTLGQLGLAELAAGYPVEAAEHLASALETPNDPGIVKYRQMLADSLTMARAQIGELAIQGGPAGADVVVNGRLVGALPLASPIKLPARTAEVVVRASGYAERRELVPIAGGQRHALTVKLAKLEKPAEPAPAVAVAPPAPTPAPLVAAPDRPTEDGASGSGLRTAAWIAGSAALVAGGTGLGLQLAARSNESAFSGSCVKTATGVMMLQTGSLTQGQCEDRLSTWESYRRWSIVSYVSGAALAVTTGILYWTSRSSTSSTSPMVVRATVQCGPSPYGVSCQGVF